MTRIFAGRGSRAAAGVSAVSRIAIPGSSAATPRKLRALARIAAWNNHLLSAWSTSAAAAAPTPIATFVTARIAARSATRVAGSKARA